MMNAAESLRRWMSVFCLALAFGMLIWGQMVFGKHLSGLLSEIYWGVCFTLSAISVVTSFIEIRLLLQEVRRQQVALIRNAMRDVRKGRARDEKDSASLN